MKTILLSTALVLSTANAFAYPGQACSVDDECTSFSGFAETCIDGACHGIAGKLKPLIPKFQSCDVVGSQCRTDWDCCFANESCGSDGYCG